MVHTTSGQGFGFGHRHLGHDGQAIGFTVVVGAGVVDVVEIVVVVVVVGGNTVVD